MAHLQKDVFDPVEVIVGHRCLDVPVIFSYFVSGVLVICLGCYDIVTY